MWNPFKRKKATTVLTTVVKNQWRNHMWVMSPTGVGVLFKYSFPNSLVHLVDAKGETIKEIEVATLELKQAKWEEIPETRRGISQEAAAKLGYA